MTRGSNRRRANAATLAMGAAIAPILAAQAACRTPTPASASTPALRPVFVPIRPCELSHQWAAEYSGAARIGYRCIRCGQQERAA